MKLSLQQLSAQAQVPVRTVRYYIQKGLLPGPEGEKRGAFYTEEHLAELLRIRTWQGAGLSLDAIAGLLQARSLPPLPSARPGVVEVRSHLTIADGLELMLSAWSDEDKRFVDTSRDAFLYADIVGRSEVSHSIRERPSG